MHLPAHPGPLGFPTVDPGKPHLGLYGEITRYLWLRGRTPPELLGSLPRARCPLSWLSSPSSNVTFSGSMSQTLLGFSPLSWVIYSLVWCPSLLRGLRTESFTHCCVPSTWHTVSALQTLPNEWTDGRSVHRAVEGLMGNPGGRVKQRYQCAKMLAPSRLSDRAGHPDTPLKGG